MFVEVPEEIKEEIKKVCREYGFEKVDFYPYYEGSGDSRSRTQARSRNRTSIIFYYNFLDPAVELYRIDSELLRGVTRVVCLHEVKHYDFPSPPDANDWEVQQRASQAYGNHKEFAILDTLLLFFSVARWLDKNELREKISKYLDNFAWLTPAEREEIVNLMSDKKFYSKRRLKKLLSDKKDSRAERFLRRIRRAFSTML